MVGVLSSTPQCPASLSLTKHSSDRKALGEELPFTCQSLPLAALLLRRLWCDLPLFCKLPCGRLLDARGHHRAASAFSGGLASKRHSGKAQHVPRSHCARVPRTGVCDVHHLNESTTDGSKSWRTDCPCSMATRRGLSGPHDASAKDRAGWERIRRRKELTHPPKLSGLRGRASLVVLACQVGGRLAVERWACHLHSPKPARSSREP